MPVNGVEGLLRVVQDHKRKFVTAHLLYCLFSEGKYERPQNASDPGRVGYEGCINADVSAQLPPNDEPRLLFESGALEFEGVG
jgi:hypothetical protein